MRTDITYIRLKPERLWRSVKYEEVYLKDYQNVHEAKQGIGDYMTFYDQEIDNDNQKRKLICNLNMAN